MKIRSLALTGLFVISTVAGFAGTISETFANDPMQHGWQIFGDTNLFTWNATNQNVEVTWDSTRPNSYYYLPLGTALTRDDTFTVSFDLRLDDITAFNNGQQIAIGLLNFLEATNTAFSRPSANSPNLFELDLFPDTGFGDSMDATLADMTASSASWNDFYFAYDDLPLPTGVICHITLAHAAGSGAITGSVYTNGILYAGLTHVYSGPIANFRLDTLSINSYADDGWGDDVLAHGVVDNFNVSFSPPDTSPTALMENFFSDPMQRGWQVFGDTNLFFWDATNQNLAVTWDSSQSNSYFYKPLGTTLTKADAFAVDFDVRLNDLQYTNTFQIAVGLLNFSNATDSSFSRTGGTSPNIFEFNYFPDDGLGEPNIAAALTDQTASMTDYPDFYFIFDVQPMNLGTSYHVRLVHAAGAPTISGTISTNGQIYTSLSKSFSGTIGDFQLDTLSVSSYSGAGQDPSYEGSILAHGSVDNFVAALPSPSRNLACALSGGQWQVEFATFTHWTYTLQRSTDMATWNDASAPVAGTGLPLTLADTNAPTNQAFYRVRAVQP